jgi:hypothetical protein
VSAHAICNGDKERLAYGGVFARRKEAVFVIQTYFAGICAGSELQNANPPCY